MRNRETDRLWEQMNQALHGRRPVDAVNYAETLLTDDHRGYLVDATWHGGDLVRQWRLNSDGDALVEPLRYRLECINRAVQYNWTDWGAEERRAVAWSRMGLKIPKTEPMPLLGKLTEDLNNALRSHKAAEARRHTETLLAPPENRSRLLDTTWRYSDVLREWTRDREQLALLQPLTDRLDAINHYAHRNRDWLQELQQRLQAHKHQAVISTPPRSIAQHATGESQGPSEGAAALGPRLTVAPRMDPRLGDNPITAEQRAGKRARGRRR